MSTTDDRVRRVFNDSLGLNLSAGELESAASTSDLLGLDSIALLEFVLGLEDEFGIVFDPESLDPEIFKDLESLARHIDSVLGAGG